MRHCTAKRWAHVRGRNLFAGSHARAHYRLERPDLPAQRRCPFAQCRCDQVHATAHLTLASTTHRQVLLVNSNSVLWCLTAAGAACRCLPRLPPWRRRAGAVSAQRSPAYSLWLQTLPRPCQFAAEVDELFPAPRSATDRQAGRRLRPPSGPHSKAASRDRFARGSTIRLA